MAYGEVIGNDAKSDNRLPGIDFAPLYRELANAPDLAPGAVLPDDGVITRGTGAYHRAGKAKPGAAMRR